MLRGEKMKYQNIMDTMKLKGISVLRLAQELGITRQALYLKLNGSREFTELEQSYIRKRLRKGWKFLFEVECATTR